MLKKVCFFSFLVLISSINNRFYNAYAAGGLMADTDQIRTVSTKWFDIIYAEECTRSALELSEKCDSIYEELCRDYNVPANKGGKEGEPQFRIPVVVTNGTDVFNAYFTTNTFNHIVLYDTGSDDDMAVFSNQFIGTFTHELTHAVSINMRSSGARKLADIFSDNINLGSIFVMPSLIKEGAAVEYESRTGEGRLNDGFYLHTVRQAKLSGKFPGYGDVTGARSKYPAGSSAYSFGGPFVKFLREKYGPELYNKFWYNAVNGGGFTFKWSFGKTYPVSLNQAWEEFKASVSVPEIKQNPLEEENITDFFSHTVKPSVKNRRGSRYSNLTAFNDGFIYSDDSGTGVYLCRKTEAGYSRPKKLFEHSDFNSLKVSLDGRYLSVAYTALNHVNPKSRVSVYDIKKDRWIDVKEQGLREACVINSEGTYYLAAVKITGQTSSLCVFRLNEKKSSFDKVSETAFSRGDQLFSPVQAGETSAAFIYKNRLSWSVLFADSLNSDTPDFSFVRMPEDVRIRTLNPDPFSDTLSFSFVRKDSFPRAGFISFADRKNASKKSCELYFEDADVSGGVYQPVVQGFNGNASEIVYAAFFYDNGSLLVKKGLSLEKSSAPVLSYSSSEAADSEGEISDSLPYKKLYWSRGSFLILSKLSMMNFTDAGKKMNDDGVEESSVPLGVVFERNNPWDSDSVTFGVGFDVFDLYGGITLGFSGQGTTSLYEYSDTVNLLFDAKGFTQVSNKFYFSSGLRLWNNSSIVLTESNMTFVGRGEIYSLLEDAGNEDYSVDLNNYAYTVNDAGLAFSTIHKTGSGIYESSGFAIGAGIKNVGITRIDGEDPDWISGMRYNSVYPYAEIALPFLIPVSCVNNFTYNLPVRIYGALLSARKTFAYINAESVLFGYEIQRGYGTIPVYFNRILLTGGYHGQLKNENRDYEIRYLKDDLDLVDDMEYEDGIYASLFIQPGLNTGAFANSAAVLKLGLQGEYHLHGEDKGKVSLSFTMSTLF
ncbi:hypothetical protein [Treponema sp.]|uniref:hypothetical protein n=1 Tax=Treponema sp. TaxID=166 RepID=UPI00257C999A|nr:hypothetical protein [Treponema sp.]MBE6354236.1 hypothetical protein [Treponema sp.]